MSIHILYGINNDNDSKQLLGYFTSQILLADAKYELTVRSKKEREIQEKWKIIEQEYETLFKIHHSEIVYPTAPKKINNIKTQSLIEYLKIQVEKGNLEQAEATREEIREIEARNIEIRRTNRQNIDEFNNKCNEIHREIHSQIKKIMGIDKYDFYCKYKEHSYQIFDSYVEEKFETDILLIED